LTDYAGKIPTDLIMNLSSNKCESVMNYSYVHFFCMKIFIIDLQEVQIIWFWFFFCVLCAQMIAFRAPYVVVRSVRDRTMVHRYFNFFLYATLP